MYLSLARYQTIQSANKYENAPQIKEFISLFLTLFDFVLLYKIIFTQAFTMDAHLKTTSLYPTIEEKCAILAQTKSETFHLCLKCF